jgi:hypothetical protein
MNRFGKLYGHTIELTVTYARLIEQNVRMFNKGRLLDKQKHSS